MKHLILTVLMISLIAGISINAQAKGRGMHDRGCNDGFERGMPLLHAPWEHVESIAREAGLNEEQITRIQTLRKDLREKVAPLHTEMELRRDDLKETMLSRSPASDKDVMKLVDRINEIRGTIFKETISGSLQIRGILTPEQYEKLQAMKQDHREDRREKRHERRERRMDDRGEKDDSRPREEMN